MEETHVLQLCGDGELTPGKTFIEEGLRRGDTVVVIGVPERWRDYAAVRRGQAKFFDARALLATAKLGEALNGIVGHLRAEERGMRVYSELTDLLWERRERARALAVEHCWNAASRAAQCSVMCACALDVLDGNAYDGALQGLSALHGRLEPAGDWSAFDEAVGRAVADVLEPRLVRMLHTLSDAHRPAMQMPTGVALLFWLKENMPRTAEKVLARSRQRWTAH